MKKILVALLCLVALSGCDKEIQIGGKIYSTTKAVEEFCYDGVVYLKFGTSTSSWGSVKMLPDGNVATCGGK